MTNLRRALWLGAESNALDGDARANPGGLFEQTVPELFAQLLKIVCGRGVVLIDQAAAALIGLPTGTVPLGPDAKNHDVAVQLRQAGFTIKEVGRWFHVSSRHIPGPGAWIGLEEFLDGDYFPMLAHPVHTTAALAEWDRITGHAWRGSAADAGNTILRAQTYRHKGKTTGATWWSWSGPDADAIELPYLEGSWHRRAGAPRIYGYDRVRAYLSAMTCTKVAGEGLAHTGLTRYAPSQAGWYLVRVGPWEFEHVMPSPAGYSYDDMTRPVWLTHPTVALLDEVAKDGFITYEILDSWTAPATDIMISYGKALRQTWQACRAIADPQVQTLVRAGVKGAYRIGHGYWRSRQSSVQRPDWAAAVTAMSRVNLWRRMFHLWRNATPQRPEGDFLGPLPVLIDNDNVWYEQPLDGCGWTIWDSTREDLDDVTELGHWRTGGVRPRKVAVG